MPRMRHEDRASPVGFIYAGTPTQRIRILLKQTSLVSQRLMVGIVFDNQK